MDLVAGLQADLMRAEAVTTLPDEPDCATVGALVIALHRRSLDDARFKPPGELG